jgi:1,4-dihydroxy-6-naphthoate synthase
MMNKLSVGISSCPNDTFAFHALMSGAVRLPGYELDFIIADVEELNTFLLEGTIDITKASFHAALLATENYGIVPCGAALGFGVGPLLVSTTSSDQPSSEDTILCPGSHTTATLLTKLFFPQVRTLKQLVFSDIVPALQNKEANFGVLIHEGRFTYSSMGLHRVCDLGELWEQKTKLPIPLGGIVAKKTMGNDIVGSFTNALRESIAYGYAHKDEALVTMQHYAQELSPEHLWPHVELYVNDQTLKLSNQAEQALQALHQMALKMSLIRPETPEFSIFN